MKTPMCFLGIRIDPKVTIGNPFKAHVSTVRRHGGSFGEAPCPKDLMEDEKRLLDSNGHTRNHFSLELLLGLGSYNHKIGYTTTGLWYEPTARV